MQAPRFDWLSFDPFSLFQDCVVAPEINIGRRLVVDAFVVSVMIVVVDERLDLGLEALGRNNSPTEYDSSGFGASARSCPGFAGGMALP